MNPLKTLFGLVVAVALLIGLWYMYKDRFNVGLFSSTVSCSQTLSTYEQKALIGFEKKALDIIAGSDTDTSGVSALDVLSIDKIKNTEPSVENIRKLFDPEMIIRAAESRFRKSLADEQSTNPSSLINAQKARIRSAFEIARSWCSKIPDIKKVKNN